MFKECPLCREKRKLLESHLIPKAAYRVIGKNKNSKRSPYLVHSRGVVETDKQLTKKLLCDGCEQRFSKRERQVARVWRHMGGFSLRDELTRYAQLSFDENGPRSQYFHRYPPISVDEETFYYFAISIMWRAGQGQWGYHPPWRVCSPELMESMRLYLMGEAARPDGIRMALYVDWAGAADMMLIPPGLQAYGVVEFLILGLFFEIYIAEDGWEGFIEGLRAGGLHVGLTLDKDRFAQIESQVQKRHHKLNLPFNPQRRW